MFNKKEIKRLEKRIESLERRIWDLELSTNFEAYSSYGGRYTQGNVKAIISLILAHLNLQIKWHNPIGGHSSLEPDNR